MVGATLGLLLKRQSYISPGSSTLATTLETYFESVLEGEEKLRDVVFEISWAASALTQLQGVLDAKKKRTLMLIKP